MEGRKKKVSKELRTSETIFFYCGKAEDLKIMTVLALRNNLKKEILSFVI